MAEHFPVVAQDSGRGRGVPGGFRLTPEERVKRREATKLAIDASPEIMAMHIAIALGKVEGYSRNQILRAQESVLDRAGIARLSQLEVDSSSVTVALNAEAIERALRGHPLNASGALALRSPIGHPKEPGVQDVPSAFRKIPAPTGVTPDLDPVDPTDAVKVYQRAREENQTLDTDRTPSRSIENEGQE